MFPYFGPKTLRFYECTYTTINFYSHTNASFNIKSTTLYISFMFKQSKHIQAQNA